MNYLMGKLLFMKEVSLREKGLSLHALLRLKEGV